MEKRTSWLPKIIIGAIFSVIMTTAVMVFYVFKIKDNLKALLNSTMNETFQAVISAVTSSTVILVVVLLLLNWLVFSLLLLFFFNAKKKYEELVYHDNLTGFANLIKFTEEYQSIMTDEQNKENYALLLFDINSFTSYKNRFGIEKSNDVVAKIGMSLNDNIKEYDIFAIEHDDRFLVLFEYNNQTEIIEFIEQVSSEIKEVTLSCGIVLINDKQQSVEKYIQLAGLALSDAQRLHSEYSVYIEISKTEMKKKIESTMEQALLNNEFVMYLQPKFDLVDKKFCGAEALVRWEKSDGTTIQPKDFIGIFEENGFIMKMDLCIVKQACKKIKEWISLGYSPLPISINVSQKYMLNSNFVAQILKILSENEIPNEMLELDITETCISVTVDKLVDMSKLFYGKEFLISMDRADAQESAINMLEDVSADTIKLNKAFFANALQNPKVYDAIKNIVYAFKKRDIKVVAEGIETKEQVEMLEQMKCQIAQGYYFSKPLSIDEFDKLIFGKKIKKKV